ncbi:hypothetical protein NSA24_03100 [Clostridioides mangenotii]|nr:hypothetical protein [Clostridioides mangenotii]MCR1953821.1 hypothetical protein [Clostridioides mangenotii]
MKVELENHNELTKLANYYWIDEGYNILEAIIKAERDSEGEYD